MQTLTQNTTETKDDAYEFYKIVSQLNAPARTRRPIETAVLVIGVTAVTIGALWLLDTTVVNIWRMLTCPC
jgi:hypothetical protein